MSKSRTFSLYLLKENYNASNALKPDNSLEDISEKCSALPQGVTLYIMDKHPTPPWWKNFWGISQDLNQTLKGSIVFLPVKDQVFALTFGHTYHNIKEESYEYDFGLRTTLNALDPEKIKSTDILQPENAKRERIQSSVGSNLTFFDFNKDESIIKRLTGAVKEEHKGILSNVTGANNLRVTSKVNSSEIAGLCEKVLDIYQKNDYKKSFLDVYNVSPIKDPKVINSLSEKLVEAFRENKIELVLSVPDMIEYNESLKVSYTGLGKSDLTFDAVYIGDYHQYLQSRNNDNITLDQFHSHKLKLKDENGNERESYSIYKCFLFDCDLESNHYHLCEGEWYRIDKNYITRLRTYLNPFFISHDILKSCDSKYENDFNKKISEQNDSYICLDRKNISPQGNVEPCDLYTIENDIAVLIHIKISTISSSLSHLFNQGINSIELLRTSEEAKSKLKNMLPKENMKTPLGQDKFKVMFGIITAKDKSKKSDNLPIFSRISLMRVIKQLELMGIQREVILIKDLVKRKREYEVIKGTDKAKNHKHPKKGDSRWSA